MNGFLQRSIDECSTKDFSFKQESEKGFYILKTQFSYAVNTIKYISSNTEITPVLEKTYKGYAEFNKWTDQKGEIDVSRFMEITDQYLNSLDKTLSWTSYFENKLKELSDISIRTKKFFGHSNEFVQLLIPIITDIFVETEKIFNGIICLGIHKYLLFGKVPGISTMDMYILASHRLGLTVPEEKRVLNGLPFMKLMPILSTIASDLL